MSNNIVNRKKSRKLLYQELYSSTFSKTNIEDFYNSFYLEKFSFALDEFYLSSIREIIKNKEGFFIYVIEKYSPKFKFNQMDIVNILPIYISLSEIFFIEDDIPIKSSINEAVELAKIFSDNSSKKIVNGVLNHVLRDIEELKKIKNEEYSNAYSIFK